MDILEYLKKRQSELEYKSHPMSDRDESFKYLYCYGLGVMAVGNLKAVTELQPSFEAVLDSIYIQQKNRNQIIIDINNYFDFRIAEFFKRINSKEVRFRAPDAECNFFEKFNKAAQEKDTSAAVTYYKEFKSEGYDISYQTLVYFFPEFEMEEHYNDITIKPGKTVVFDRFCQHSWRKNTP